MIRPAISFRIFAATIEVMLFTSFRGFTSTMSAPTRLPLNVWIVSRTCLVESPAWLRVGYPRRICRVEAVDVHRDIHGTIEGDSRVAPEVAHLDHLDSEFGCLFTLVARCCPNPDLDKPLGEPVFHDPGKRGCVRVGVVLKIMIEIGMGVEM